MNSHAEQAQAYLDQAAKKVGHEALTATGFVAFAQARAALAIAEELRTANILALAALQASQRDIDGARQLRDAAAERLGNGSD